MVVLRRLASVRACAAGITPCLSHNPSCDRMKLKINDCLCPKQLCSKQLLMLALLVLMTMMLVSIRRGDTDAHLPEVLSIKRYFNPAPSGPHMERPMAIMFTTFSNRTDKLFIYTNTIKNWAAFLPYIQPVLYTTFPSGPLVDAARESGWYVYPCPAVNRFNSPVMQDMYRKSFELFNASMYGYANGDILFDWGLNDTIATVTRHLDTFGPTLLFGLRSNYNVTSPEDYVTDPLWPQARINMLANSNLSALFRPQFGDASDYFFVSPDFPFSKTAAVVVSRAGFDTYLVSVSNNLMLATIDGTGSISAIHQTDADGNMAHEKLADGMAREDFLYNRIMLKDFKPRYGRARNALHFSQRRDGRVFIECNKVKHRRSGPCKTDKDLF